MEKNNRDPFEDLRDSLDSQLSPYLFGAAYPDLTRVWLEAKPKTMLKRELKRGILQGIEELI